MAVVAKGSPQRRWQLISVLLCTLFSIAYILNIHPTGDGIWFWTANSVRNGQGLYTDLHFTLQPLFVVITAWSQAILGTSWLASKLVALAQPVLYLIGIYKVAQYIPWDDKVKAWLIAGVFMMTITSPYYRFDDYHITVHFLVVWSVYLALRMNESSNLREKLWIAAGLGVLSGLALSDRLNDGAALFGGLVLVWLATVPARQLWKIVPVFSFCALLALLAVVRLSDKSLYSWAYYSILHVAAIKGGTGNVLVSVPLFPLFAFHEFFWHWHLPFVVIAFFLGIAAVGSFGLWDGRKRSLAARAVSVVLLLGICTWFLRLGGLGVTIDAFAVMITLCAFVVAAWVCVRWFRRGRQENLRYGRELILILPTILLFGSAMTSGKSVLESYPPTALFLLLLPVGFPLWSRQTWVQRIAVLLCGVLAISSLEAKAAKPYHWHAYSDGPMFSQRTWYKHPDWGWMYIDKTQLQMMTDMCGEVQRQGGDGQLLSIPYPYPNYFCNIPPWHGYVQTWYDTTGAKTIAALVHDLDENPPKWVVYQRDLPTLQAHEWSFNHGKPIPHRKLDAFIVSRVEAGKWTLVSDRELEGAHWLLIRTR